MPQYDVFISHASEDKADVARPLADFLQRAGLSVWMDEFELRIGDSLRDKIDLGLNQSRFGIVILSPNFFAKEWPKRELNALFAIEENAEKVILPIWHRVQKDEVRQFSPILADRLAANTAQGLHSVARSIADVVQKKDVTAKSHGIKTLNLRVENDALSNSSTLPHWRLWLLLYWPSNGWKLFHRVLLVILAYSADSFNWATKNIYFEPDAVSNPFGSITSYTEFVTIFGINVNPLIIPSIAFVLNVVTVGLYLFAVFDGYKTRRARFITNR